MAEKYLNFTCPKCGQHILEEIMINCIQSSAIDTITDEGHVYVDGGIIDNFPIQLMKKKLKNTIGLAIYNTDNKQINTFNSYIKSLVTCMIFGQDDIKIRKYRKNVIAIHLPNEDLLSFDMTKKHKKHLFTKGKNASIAYFMEILNSKI